MAGSGQDNPPPGSGEQNQNPPITDPPAQGGEAPPPSPQQPEPAPVMDWRDRRIGEQQARLRERNARIAELEAQLNQARGGQAPQPGQGNGQQWQPPAGQPPQQPLPYNQGDIQRQIDEAASRMASVREFNRRCDEVAAQGRTQYQNFDQRVQRLVGLIDNNDPQQRDQYNAFLNACLETGQAARLVFDLGGDLNEASRIMAMEPVRMAVELTKLSTRATTTEASRAPSPLNPMASAAQAMRTSVQPDDADNADSLSTEEWMRRREEQVASRRQRTLG